MGIIQEKRDANKPAVEQTGYGVTRVNVSEGNPADKEEKREEVVAEAAAVVEEQTVTSSSAAAEETEVKAEEPAPIPVPKKGRPKKKARR